MGSADAEQQQSSSQNKKCRFDSRHPPGVHLEGLEQLAPPGPALRVP